MFDNIETIKKSISDLITIQEEHKQVITKYNNEYSDIIPNNPYTNLIFQKITTLLNAVKGKTFFRYYLEYKSVCADIGIKEETYINALIHKHTHELECRYIKVLNLLQEKNYNDFERETEFLKLKDIISTKVQDEEFYGFYREYIISQLNPYFKDFIKDPAGPSTPMRSFNFTALHTPVHINFVMITLLYKISIDELDLTTEEKEMLHNKCRRFFYFFLEEGCEKICRSHHETNSREYHRIKESEEFSNYYKSSKILLDNLMNFTD